MTAAGVGTNRYAYAGGDPVNASDPGGSDFTLTVQDELLWQNGDRSTFSYSFGGHCGTQICRGTMQVWSGDRLVASALGSPVPNTVAHLATLDSLAASGGIPARDQALAWAGYIEGSLTLDEAMNMAMSGNPNGSGIGNMPPTPGRLGGGTQTFSTNLFSNGRVDSRGYFRIDIENPNPGQRPGQTHVQFSNRADDKYIYNPSTRTFNSMGDNQPLSGSRLGLLQTRSGTWTPEVQRAIDRGREYLGLEPESRR